MNFNNLGVYSVIFLNICIPVAQESHFNAGCKVQIPINGMHNKIDIWFYVCTYYVQLWGYYLNIS